MNEMVSVVLPVFNGEKYLDGAIESVLTQTYSDLELIIVDDCSSDNTPQIIRKWENKDRRIKVITNATNQKLPKSLNLGFSIAQGQYYTWTSDDNLYKKNAIETMVDFLNQNREIDFVYSDYDLINDDGECIGQEVVEDSNRIIFSNVIGACFLYRESIAKVVGEYDYDMFLAEDYDYWLRIFQNGVMSRINENIYMYRIHPGSLTAQKQKEISYQTAIVLDKYYDKICERCTSKKELHRYFSSVLSYMNDRHKKVELIKKYMRYDKSYVFDILFGTK